MFSLADAFLHILLDFDCLLFSQAYEFYCKVVSLSFSFFYYSVSSSAPSHLAGLFWVTNKAPIKISRQ